MTVLVAVLLAWDKPTPGDAMVGKATYYSDGLMEKVAANRRIDLTGVLGGVALNRAGDLRRMVWLEYQGVVSGPWLSVDCARRGTDYKKREHQGRVVEVPYEWGQKWRMVGWGPRGPVTVHFTRPEWWPDGFVGELPLPEGRHDDTDL